MPAGVGSKLSILLAGSMIRASTSVAFPAFQVLAVPRPTDLRQFTGWGRARSLSLFSVRRAGIETFARELEGLGRARATVTRRLRTITGSSWPLER